MINKIYSVKISVNAMYYYATLSCSGKMRDSLWRLFYTIFLIDYFQVSVYHSRKSIIQLNEYSQLQLQFLLLVPIGDNESCRS